MTDDQIIQLLKEIDMCTHTYDNGMHIITTYDITKMRRFAERIATAEREACVELCLEHSKLNVDNENVEFSHLASYEFGKQVGAATCATAIRARGEV